MDLDSKHKLLYALYAEYQKDIPNMKSVTFRALEMDLAVFQMAYIKLQNEGFIQGLLLILPDAILPSKIKSMKTEGVLLTRFGVTYVEDNLNIKPNYSANEKLMLLFDKFGKLGWLVLQNVTENIINSYSELDS